MTHQLRTWPRYFATITTGRKTFEVRQDDRGFTVGDVLHLVHGGETGREVKRTVTYITRHSNIVPLADGYVVMALGEVTQ